LKEARCQLAIPHNNLNFIWGVGGGIQPLNVLKEKVSVTGLLPYSSYHYT